MDINYFLNIYQLSNWIIFPELRKINHNRTIYKKEHILCLHKLLFFSSFLKKIYLLLERGEGRETERERNINVWLLLASLSPGTCPQPRHVPWLGIEPVTFLFVGRHSIHWATPARAYSSSLQIYKCRNIQSGFFLLWFFFCI